VLDVGCGSGMLGKYLSSNKNCIVDGVDLNIEAIDVAKDSYRSTFVFNLESENLANSKPATSTYAHAAFQLF
jgi:methylase of polypeptide subunit release factors